MTTTNPSSAEASLRGILWMLLAIFLFVSMDATAKYLSQSYPVQQVVWARYVFHVLVVGLALNVRMPRLLRSRRLGLQLLRSLLLVGTTGCFFSLPSGGKLVRKY